MKNSKKIIVAIDGFSSSGKSTMARRLASEVGYRYIDSGAMYRAVALFGLENGSVKIDGTIDEKALLESIDNIEIDFSIQPDGSQHTLLNGVDVEAEIRRLRVSNVVSDVAAIPEIRHKLVSMQQSLGKNRGIVMDGRDIGTTVFPDAELKIFVDASAQTRAMRRFNELFSKGQHVTYEDILANVAHRDNIDLNRSESPLKCADDALRLDNSDMTLEQQDQWLREAFNNAVGK